MRISTSTRKKQPNVRHAKLYSDYRTYPLSIPNAEFESSRVTFINSLHHHVGVCAQCSVFDYVFSRCINVGQQEPASPVARRRRDSRPS